MSEVQRLQMTMPRPRSCVLGIDADFGNDRATDPWRSAEYCCRAVCNAVSAGRVSVNAVADFDDGGVAGDGGSGVACAAIVVGARCGVAMLLVVRCVSAAGEGHPK